MEIINETELHTFALKHSNARKSLASWAEVTRTASWKTFAELRMTFGSADYVKDQVIFDIGGNNYRLIASVHYTTQRVYILDVLTHAEYDRWNS